MSLASPNPGDEELLCPSVRPHGARWPVLAATIALDWQKSVRCGQGSMFMILFSSCFSR